MEQDTIVDLLENLEETNRMETTPILDWVFSSEEPGSLRCEFEHAESILEKLESERKKREERPSNGTFTFGGGSSSLNAAEEKPKTTPPSIKSLSYKEKDGTWTTYDNIFRTHTHLFIDFMLI